MFLKYALHSSHSFCCNLGCHFVLFCLSKLSLPSQLYRGILVSTNLLPSYVYRDSAIVHQYVCLVNYLVSSTQPLQETVIDFITNLSFILMIVAALSPHQTNFLLLCFYDPEKHKFPKILGW